MNQSIENIVTPSEFVTKTTIRIETIRKNSEEDFTTSYGTGFLYRSEEINGKIIEALVTNKHVVLNAFEFRFFLNISVIENGKLQKIRHETIRMQYEQFEDAILMHPDENIDLCAINFSPIIQHYANNNEFVLRATLDSSNVATEEYCAELNAIEDIIMVGYPSGLFDDHNNAPISRMGITATDPSLNFNGMPVFVIDCACFPGSSGSPIFHYNKGIHTDRKGSTTISPPSFKLLGILYSGPIYGLDGEIIVKNIPTDSKLISKTNIMINLGYCIKAMEINWLDKKMKHLLSNKIEP